MRATASTNSSPLPPKAIHAIFQVFAVRFFQIALITTHFQPQFAFVTRTDSQQQDTLEFGRRGPTFDNVRRNRSLPSLSAAQSRIVQTQEKNARPSKCRARACTTFERLPSLVVPDWHKAKRVSLLPYLHASLPHLFTSCFSVAATVLPKSAGVSTV